jgi:carbamoyl-phosphate synthase large subunit
LPGKEIEFETMRDGRRKRHRRLLMENVDPVGVHTGDSIVVAPTLTLAVTEFQMLRSARWTSSHLGIGGRLQVQMALDPVEFETRDRGHPGSPDPSLWPARPRATPSPRSRQ